MLFLISPAKSLDYETPASDLPHTQPLFTAQSALLIKALRKKTWRQVAKLMDLSQNLAELNVARYAAWTDEFTPQNAKQAALAFNGDVYDGLVAKTLPGDDLAWVPLGILRVVPFVLALPGEPPMRVHASAAVGCLLIAAWAFWE